MYEEVHDGGATPTSRARLEVEPLSAFSALGMIFRSFRIIKIQYQRSLGDKLVIDKTLF